MRALIDHASLLTVNGDRAQGDDPADGGLARRGHHRGRAADVDPVIFVYPGRGFLEHVQQRRHVHDDVDAIHRPPERGRIVDFRAGVRVRRGSRPSLGDDLERV